MKKYKRLQGLSPDALVKELWRGNHQFADLFNSLVYRKQKISPESLREMDTDLSTMIAEKELVKTIKSVRDIVKVAGDGSCYQILAMENQQSIHYAMPFRCLLYDALTYYQQYKQAAARNKKEKLTDRNEFLSGFQKTDRFIPCRTIVLYYGEEKWDAARKLSDLMAFTSEEDRCSFNEYQYDLICLNEIDISQVKFHDKKTRDFFLYVTSVYQNGGLELPRDLETMDTEVAYIAAAVTGSYMEHGRKIIEQMKEGRETMDMCEAMRKVLQEEQEKGMEKGMETLIINYLSKDNRLHQAALMLGISEDKVRTVAAKHGIGIAN